jgi:outer membrane protein OmpA-like peptidoglycan-associated protein
MLATAGWLLTGCSSTSSMNPINWWHRTEGGKIAEQRPAPPGADQPYPNLATVPPKPAPADQQALKKLTDSLVADRTNAQHAAQSAPLADPSSPTASPSLFGVGTAPPPPPAVSTASGNPPPAASGAAGTPVASASIPAVTAPAAPPSPAPRKPVQSAPLEAPAADASAAGTPAPAGNASVPASTPPAAPTAPAASGTAPGSSPGSTIAGVSPALPAGPPPRPTAAGAAPTMPVAVAPIPIPSAGPSAQIVFPERTSNLSTPATDEVKAFATKRGSGTISIVGYGDSASSDPDAQSAALDLGLSRAQSIVDALKAAGVPGNAIRVSAEASGRGASLRVIQ